MRQRRIVFVNRYYWPDQSATSQILTDLTRELAGPGYEVHVVTSRQRFDDPDAGLPASERAAGVQVHRVRTSTHGRQRLAGRALDYASFYFTAGWCLARLLRRGDVVVAKTDPPLIAMVASLAARLRGATLVNWQQDVFPEVATALGASPLPQALDALLARLRDANLRAARLNVVISAGMRARLAARGVPQGSLHVIENWAVAAPDRAIATNESALRRSLGPEARFVVAYSGNFGRAHEFDTLVDAAALLRDEPGIVFLMVGAGAQLPAIKARVAALGLANVRFLRHQAREALADALAAADVHVASLQPALEGLVFPSKLYGILAAGRPVLFIGDPQGDVAQWIAAHEVGLSVGIGAAQAAADTVRRLAADSSLLDALGGRARVTHEQSLGLEQAVARWRLLLDAPASERARPPRPGTPAPAAHVR